MNEPIVFKRSVLIGQLVLMQLLVPPIVAISTLYGLTLLYGVRFDGEFRTLAVLVALYIFGGSVLRNFTLAMLFGVIVGTYSSIFIAAPLLGYLGVKRDWSATAEKKPTSAKA